MSLYDIILAHPITSAIAIIVVLWIIRIAADFAFLSPYPPPVQSLSGSMPFIFQTIGVNGFRTASKPNSMLLSRWSHRAYPVNADTHYL